MRCAKLTCTGYELFFHPTHEPEHIIDQSFPPMTMDEANRYARDLLGMKMPTNEDDL